jgi:Protein of unknown function (DUF3179)
MITSPSRTRSAFIKVLPISLFVSLFCLVYPMYVIRPFRAQGARELAIALVVTRFRPLLTVLSAAAALAVLGTYWRAEPGKWRRALASVGAALVCALAVLARVNVYEHMFHPDEHPSFAAASRVKLDPDEKVLAIKIGRAARAYPIRIISYHHVINDVLDRVGIVATY